jgi:hypothetical protein
MRILRLLGIAAAVIAASHVCFAQTLFTYTFSDVTTSSGKSSAGSVASNITFSSFTASSAVAANSSAANVFGFATWTTGATNGSNTFSGALDLTRYYEFTLTPQIGYSLSLTDISFDAGRSATGPRQFAIRSSSDSYASNIAGTATGVVSTVGGNLFQFTDNASTNLIAGQSITMSAFTNLTTALTLRIYAFNAEAGTGTFRIDNLAINGTVSAIPEPSTYAAIFGALALAGVVVHRRRQARR